MKLLVPLETNLLKYPMITEINDCQSQTSNNTTHQKTSPLHLVAWLTKRISFPDLYRHLVRAPPLLYQPFHRPAPTWGKFLIGGVVQISLKISLILILLLRKIGSGIGSGPPSGRSSLSCSNPCCRLSCFWAWRSFGKQRNSLRLLPTQCLQQNHLQLTAPQS